MRSSEFNQILKIFVIGAGIGIPLIFGHWRYTTSSEANVLIDAITWALLSTPFSLGLFLSVTRIGRRLRPLTLVLMILGALAHLIFSVYPFVLFPILALGNLAATFLLFRRLGI